MEEIEGVLVWDRPKSKVALKIIAEFRKLPENVQQQRHEEFNEACKDADTQWMQEVVNGR